ncbi:unnamed protein product [Protopolystoma xenopodis]|uniref:Uncharacterized protein n=1 Tax=Protopolystoma xenopodis TaxID=117903 RepID=A0A448X1E4_9PLAT|nr:unnamed protein product [Protopolystoma xenopodis]
MWWMLQHYFGIGSRVHHVRLRWGHLRLVSGLVDPMTGQPCEAVEYQGPTEFATVRPAALLEATAVPDGMHISTPRRRVYPSSGWAEPEIAVAEALLGGVTSDFVNPPPPAGSQVLLSLLTHPEWI